MSERETLLDGAPGDPLRVRESATAVTIALSGERRVTIILPDGRAVEVWAGALHPIRDRRRPPEILTHGFPWHAIAMGLYGLTCFGLGIVAGVFGNG